MLTADGSHTLLFTRSCSNTTVAPFLTEPRNRPNLTPYRERMQCKKKKSDSEGDRLHLTYLGRRIGYQPLTVTRFARDSDRE